MDFQIRSAARPHLSAQPRNTKKFLYSKMKAAPNGSVEVIIRASVFPGFSKIAVDCL
ncbi:MAG: hypothetical protein GX415_01315 [Chloroflexi bacterium]|jgi:hypothetical protein|nr:hypothetical protein [Chloroflexota bacterium]HOE34229.1 hypothetical protein [Anaerolineaceae bacterium]HOT25826.1 hypothetical protein [Anaerolineaceae bacterium]HQH58237.1 hypothetical protein [Anaerolineaceae bacterium]HQK04191.1 hypothetical protein [Anaerolineaceae bacterium]